MPGIRRAIRQETEDIMKTDPLYWLRNLVISGREGDEDDEGNDSDDEGNDSGDDGQEDEDQENDKGDSSDNEDDPEKLKARLAKADEALKKERKLRREAQRDARAKKRTQAASDDAEEVEDKDKAKLQKKVSASEEKVARLAKGFRTKAIDDAIKDEARKQGFIDPTDALLDSVRAEVDYEQNDDDPSDVDIDFESVEDAVKDLASRKKHLIGSGTPGGKSGGKFRKKQGANDDGGPNLTQLQQDYPSLR